MATQKTPLSKSDFVRSQPATLTAAEVLAKARDMGLKLTSQLVYKVRATAKSNGKAKRSSGNSHSTGTGTSKAAFVRGLSNLSPREIVEKAKAAGMKLDLGYVYNIRGAAKRGSTKRRSEVRLGASVPRPITTSSGAESLLKALASEIGLGPAIEILSAERARVRALIGR